MWKPFRCRLFRDHDYAIRRQPGEMFLECRRCGRRSQGWLMSQAHLQHTPGPLRLRIAEPWETTYAITLTDSVGTTELAPSSDSPKLRLVLADFGAVEPRNDQHHRNQHPQLTEEIV